VLFILLFLFVFEFSCTNTKAKAVPKSVDYLKNNEKVV